MSEARKVIKYLSKLRVTQGPRAGQQFKVLPWEKEFIRGFLKVDISALSVARGNGKTSLLAAVGTAALSGPLARPRGEVLLVAGSFDQAKISFDHILNFLPSNNERYRVQDSANNASILDKETGCTLRCSGATARLLHGRAPHLILADEPSAWLHTQTEKIVSAIVTSMGKHDDGRVVFLGTRPGSESHFFQKMLDGGAAFSACYAATKQLYENKPFLLSTIRKANPSLDWMPDLKKAILKDAERAKKDESLLPSYLALRLNAGVSDVLESVLLEAGTWQRIEGNAEAKGPTVWGVDLGGSAAAKFNLLPVSWPRTGRLEAVSAFPEHPTLKTRGTKDGVASLYEQCHRRGELIVAGQFTTDVKELLRVALARWGKPSQIVCDRYREADLREALGKAGIPLCRLIFRGQGFRDGAQDVRDFRKACLDGNVVPVKSLLIRSAMAVARTVSDVSGNAKLAKTGQGKRPGARDDAAAATILAIASGTREPPRPSQPVKYFKV